MRAKELIKRAGLNPEIISDDFEVKGISCNSKHILDNFVFVAVKGTHADGHNFIEEAIEKGAKAVVAHRGHPSQVCLPGRGKSVPKSVSVILVEDTRKALASLAGEFYGNPSKKVKVIGITGTNGKTTVSYLVEALLKEAGFTPAVLGTINYRFKDREIPSWNTTPGVVELQAMLAEMSETGVDYAVMEVSSHALDQSRTEGINFHSAIFTNLTQDHLDYHGTIDNYFAVKALLFRHLSPQAFAVINTDDEYGLRLKGLTPAKVITYGIKKDAFVTAKNIKFDMTHTEFTLELDKKLFDFKTPLIGRHNVYNALAALAWGVAAGLDFKVLESAIKKFGFVPGRLERINVNGSFNVFVDYAHTEDALYNVIVTLRELSQGRLIVVFGCGGERDRTKRPKMGKVVSELADYSIITSDNPRSEPPESIVEDIKTGINKDNCCVVLDRREAIKRALSLAKPGDTVLLAGKGHENYQVLKDKILHFDDREVVRECLKSMNY